LVGPIPGTGNLLVLFGSGVWLTTLSPHDEVDGKCNLVLVLFGSGVWLTTLLALIFGSVFMTAYLVGSKSA
jgi:hypothetical protein